MRLCSFDVFDTLVTRRVALPADVFQAVADVAISRKLTALSPVEFVRERQAAELRARQSNPAGEIVLADIYRNFAQHGGCDPDSAQALMELELECEAKVLVAIPGAREWVAAERAGADSVAFVSDMYLPAEFLRQILQREGFFRAGDRLYVSGEQGCSKHQGTLYRKIREELKDIQTWKHFGDNLHADVKIPRQLSIDAQERPEGRLSRYEQQARGGEAWAPWWRSRWAAAMRIARLSNPETEPSRRIIWETAVEVVGPLLFGYVYWVLTRAAELGIRRLYFVSRDGQILLKIANIIKEAWAFDIECRYLYGSRQAWHPAANYDLGTDDIERLIPGKRSTTLRTFLEGLGCDPDVLRETVPDVPFSADQLDVPIGDRAREVVLGLLADPSIRACLHKMSDARGELLISYLRQESFFDGTPCAFVDIGWFGNMQKSLSKCLVRFGHLNESRLKGFYFAFLGGEQSKEGRTSFSYLSDETCGLTASLSKLNLALIEIFTAADHGSVMGYQLKGDRIVPRLLSHQNDLAGEWGLATLHAGVVGVVNEIVKAVPRREADVTLVREISVALFDQFYFKPAKQEVDVWAKFKHSGEQIEKKFPEFLPDLTWWEMTGAVFHADRRPVYWWVEGALARRPCFPLNCYRIFRSAYRKFRKNY